MKIERLIMTMMFSAAGCRLGRSVPRCSALSVSHSPAYGRCQQAADEDLALLALGIMIYALFVYHWRASAIRKRGTGPYDDRLGPVRRHSSPFPPQPTINEASLLYRHSSASLSSVRVLSSSANGRWLIVGRTHFSFAVAIVTNFILRFTEG